MFFFVFGLLDWEAPIRARRTIFMSHGYTAQHSTQTTLREFYDSQSCAVRRQMRGDAREANIDLLRGHRN